MNEDPKIRFQYHGRFHFNGPLSLTLIKAEQNPSFPDPCLASTMYVGMLFIGITTS